jgi:hypothetical protein
MSFGNYLEGKILEQAFGARSFTPAATLYVHLYTAAPADGGGGTEVSTAVWTNYAAAAVTNDSTKWSTFEDNAQVPNLAEISFGTATISGTAPIVTHFAIKDGSGNLYGWAALNSSKTINNGDPVKFAAGAVVISLD